MPAAPTADRSIHSWNRDSLSLARRVNRRAGWAAFNRPLGIAVLVAGHAALAWRLLGPTLPGRGGDVVVLCLVAAGLLVGVIGGVRALRRVRPVDVGDAAWALDRLADADGRGLTAAVAHGPAASEAVWAEPRIGPPPRVKLLPPGGLVFLVGGSLLVALVLLGGRRAEETGSPPATGTPLSGGPASAQGAGGEGDAGVAERRARTLDQRAAATRQVRTALGLPPEGPLDSREAAALLADPALRRKAAAAATPGTPLAELLRGSGGDATGDALANLLQQDRADHAEASRLRREAAGARARTSTHTIPPQRRMVVKRYLERIE